MLFSTTSVRSVNASLVRKAAEVPAMLLENSCHRRVNGPSADICGVHRLHLTHPTEVSQ